MSYLIEFLSEIETLKFEEKKYLKNLFIQKEIEKNTLIIKQGEISKDVYFLDKGIMAMIYNKDKKKFVKDFIFWKNPAMAYPSFFTREPSSYSIMTLTDCSLQVLTKKNYDLAKNKIPKLKSIAHKITNEAHKNIEERFKSLITQTPEERYIELMSKRPHLLNFISLKMIASYLGITDVALSRIRNRISKKGAKQNSF